MIIKVCRKIRYTVMYTHKFFTRILARKQCYSLDIEKKEVKTILGQGVLGVFSSYLITSTKFAINIECTEMQNFEIIF